MKSIKFKCEFANISIKWKIFAYLIGFCTILLILLWLFQVVLLDSFYKHIKVNEVKNSALSISKNISNDNLDELLEQISLSNDICIEILSENGEIYYSSDGLRNCMIQNMPPWDKIKIFAKAKKNGGELIDYYIPDDFHSEPPDKTNFLGIQPRMERGLQEIIFSKIMKNKNGDTVFILIDSVISPVNSTISTLEIQLIYITVVMIVFSIILAFFIAQKISKPIEKISNSAKILATGKYDISFEGSGYKEIKELSDTLNFASSELSKVDDLRKELIANISHDLRTPLTLIGGYAEAMRDLPDENNAENAQIIIDETTRLTTLVNNVLDLSKIQSGMQKFNLASFNLTDSIEHVINRVNELVKVEGYTISFIYDSNVIITADETRITQALYNLLVNAINYSGDDKTVVVKQLTSDHKVKIEVIDNGEGIPSEKLPYIWDRYFKSDEAHKRAVTGSGIGLSIVKSIIEMHEGEYGVNSSLNEGSVFWFKLKR